MTPPPPERPPGSPGRPASQSDGGIGTSPETAERRNFLSKIVAVVTGSAIIALPVAASTGFFLGPILRRFRAATGNTKPGKADGAFLPVTLMASLPDDGRPKSFTVHADVVDAWNKFMNQPVGRIFLRKRPDGTVSAFNVRCPHAGCAVDYRPSENDYLCPCHKSAFDLEGAKKNEIPPRGMDELEVKVLNGGEVWVRYQSFKAVTPEKVPVSE